MVEEYTGDKPFNTSAKAILSQTGSNKATFSQTGKANPNTKPRIMANGTDLILSDDGPGIINNKYIRFKDATMVDMSINRSQDAYTQLTVTFNVYAGFDTKNIEIPNYLPVEQHPRYVQGVFDAKR